MEHGSSRRQGEHEFGGTWTEIKLEMLRQYLTSYTKALKKTSFQKVYIDAFAGTGYRTLKHDDTGELLLPELADDEAQGWLDGSAVIALKTDPAFDQYVFIDRKQQHCDALECLRSDFPNRNIQVHRDEANACIRRICGGRWRDQRAVMFLDPYGTQVEWTTLEAIARTNAIDLWLLFPLGAGVNRMLTRTGDMHDSWKRRLDVLLGTEAWRDRFYAEPKQTSFLPDAHGAKEKCVDCERIGRFFNERLATIFAGVAPEPRPLYNSAGCPLYLLCFAVGNPNGKNIALKIAGHILRTVS